MRIAPLVGTRNQEALTRDAVILTGTARSGTTLVGKILATLDRLEYHYEPAGLYMILGLVVQGALDWAAGAELLRVYLCEDLLLETILGRRVNLRARDDSCFLIGRTREEWERRMNCLHSRRDAAEAARRERKRLCVKMPLIHDSLGFLTEALGACQILMMVRDGRDVVQSMLRKGWLEEDALLEEFWPYRRTPEGNLVPYWVEDSMAAFWKAANPETRACYLWRRHAQLALEFRESRAPGLGRRYLEVRFESLRERPEETVRNLCAFLDCRPTPLTERQVRDIRPPAAPAAPPPLFLGRVDAGERARFEEMNRRWGYEP